MKEDFLLSSYYYHLPSEQIAQFPSEKREESRLLVLDRQDGTTRHLKFRDIVRFLNPGDCLVINKTKVFPARLLGTKPTGGKIEFLLLELPREKTQGFSKARAIYKTSKPIKPGLRVTLSRLLEVVVEKRHDNGQVDLLLEYPRDIPRGILGVLERVGTVPLPPYIRRQETLELDKTRYQTVYARDVGSVAAPTAGLHFSKEILELLEEKGVKVAPVTLHVGYGTFSPIRTKDIRRHKIHSEWIRVSEKSARIIEETRQSGRKVIPVGTTSVRTVEFVFKKRWRICPFSGQCDLYIYPGFRFEVTEAMLTNFHLPYSSLLVLVSAFAGRKKVIETYKEAVELGYRFFSYGDAMFIL